MSSSDVGEGIVVVVSFDLFDEQAGVCVGVDGFGGGFERIANGRIFLFQQICYSVFY